VFGFYESHRSQLVEANAKSYGAAVMRSIFNLVVLCYQDIILFFYAHQAFLFRLLVLLSMPTLGSYRQPEHRV